MGAREKRKLVRIISSILIALMLIFAQQQAWIPGGEKIETTIENSTPGRYSVVSFDDGDTIVVDMQGRKEQIRFIGVDTPETKDPRKPVQCYGKEASSFTKQIIGEQPVRLEADPESSNRDRYDRLLRYVYLPNGTLLNQLLVSEGFGFAITGFPFTKMDEFVAAQNQARTTQKGLWGKCQLETINDILRTVPE